jgi:hypothetical protein
MSDEVAMKIIGLLESIEGRLVSIDRHLSKMRSATVDAPPPPIDPQQSYTREQTARLLRVSVWTVDRARKDGTLVEARRVGQRDVRIVGESILRFHEAARRAPVQVLKL